MNVEQLSCGIIADFTAQPLADLLRNDGVYPRIEAAPAPPGHVSQALMELRDGGWKHQPDLAVVWTRPEVIPCFRSLLDFEPVKSNLLLEQVDQFAGLLIDASAGVGCLFATTWSVPWYRRGLGLLSMHPEFGWAYNVARMNMRLAERVERTPNVYLLDSARWLSKVGAEANNPKLWYAGKIAFSLEVFREASAEIKAAVCGLAGLSRKLILLDLDDTLWGGIVGEDGWQNLRLGGHDPVGEAFLEFQRALKALTRTGVLIGIVSKNDQATALAAIDNHPEMVLRRDDFAGWRINWHDKAENIVDLVSELNLGLDAVVFIDDSPAERSRVRGALPEVAVPEWPSDKLLYARTLLEMTVFDRPAITEEDQTRTQTYAFDRQRRSSQLSSQSVTEWLAELGLVVEAARLDGSDVVRGAQLLNKTNQMNLRTRRLTQTELLEWSHQPGHAVFVFGVSDRFGDYGLTGLASLKGEGGCAQIADFLLSCRVMGRGVESAMLYFLIEQARSQGFRELMSEYKPTRRNSPCLAFFDSVSGFRREGDNFWWDTQARCVLPEHITLKRREVPLGSPQYDGTRCISAATSLVSE
ncbi:MAG: HAD-IIIC family phosphatase [Acidobacteriota bacterium]